MKPGATCRLCRICSAFRPRLSSSTRPPHPSRIDTPSYHRDFASCSSHLQEPDSKHASIDDLSAVRKPLPPDRQRDDIVPGDLAATLEKHRASNVASIIRRTPSRPRRVKKQLHNRLLPNKNHGDSSDSPQPKEALVQNDIAILKYGRRSGNAISRASQVPDAKEDLSFNILRHKRDLSKGAYCSPGIMSDQHNIPRGWWLDMSEAPTNKRDRINREISALVNFMAVDESASTIRKEIRASTVKYLQTRMPHCQFHLFGSDVTGLATFMSDIDVGFYLKSAVKPKGARQPSQFSKPARKKIIAILFDVRNELYRLKVFTRPKVVHARYPLVPAVHIGTQIQVSVVSCNPEFQRMELVNYYLAEHTNLRPLYLFLKAVLISRNLDDVRYGGLGSYTLLIMIVTCFKITKTLRKDDLCTSLLTFLHFYGNFNTGRQAISAEPAMFYRKHASSITESLESKEEMKQDQTLYWRHRLSTIDAEKPWLLCLQDPADMTNDLGKKTYRYMDIKETFRKLNDSLRNWLANAESSKPPMEEFFGNKIFYQGALRKARLAAFEAAIIKKTKSSSPKRDANSIVKDIQTDFKSWSTAMSTAHIGEEAPQIPNMEDRTEEESGVQLQEKKTLLPSGTE